MSEEMIDAKRNISEYIFDRLIDLVDGRARAKFVTSDDTASEYTKKEAASEYAEICGRIDELKTIAEFLAEQFC